MILIVDRALNVKNWLSSAPLKDLDIFDISGSGIDLQTLSAANLIIIVDYEATQFRVIKDRHPCGSEYEDHIDHISQLGAYIGQWTFVEASTRIADSVRKE
jgi:hypothetical protein